MEKAPTFLTAEWRDLVFLSYFVPPEVLVPYLPAGLELDLFDGSAVVSLVAFRFLNTRFAGIRAPLFHSFSELNLRFYVRDPKTSNRGVVFIREICPYYAVAWVARLLFSERFIVRESNFATNGELLNYRFKSRTAEKSGELSIRINSQQFANSSFVQFATDRYHGFTKVTSTATLHFEVSHEPRQIFDASIEKLELDLDQLCDTNLSRALGFPPNSVLYAKGGAVDLSWGKLLPACNVTREVIWPTPNQKSLS